jgi:hypothetical protein
LLSSALIHSLHASLLRMEEEERSVVSLSALFFSALARFIITQQSYQNTCQPRHIHHFTTPHILPNSINQSINRSRMKLLAIISALAALAAAQNSAVDLSQLPPCSVSRHFQPPLPSLPLTRRNL